MIFLDTSALVKRYVEEAESVMVIGHMAADPTWAASVIARVEAEVTLCHRGLGGRQLRATRRQLADDWDRMLSIPLDADCLAAAAGIGCEYGVRTLDALHLAAATRLPGPLTFLSFDRDQAAAAERLGFLVPI